jgi:hypothetical protein
MPLAPLQHCAFFQLMVTFLDPFCFAFNFFCSFILLFKILATFPNIKLSVQFMNMALFLYIFTSKTHLCSHRMLLSMNWAILTRQRYVTRVTRLFFLFECWGLLFYKLSFLGLQKSESKNCPSFHSLSKWHSLHLLMRFNKICSELLVHVTPGPVDRKVGIEVR